MKKLKYIFLFIVAIISLNGCHSDIIWHSILNPRWLYKTYTLNDAVNTIEFEKIDSITIYYSVLNNQKKIKDFKIGNYRFEDSIYFNQNQLIFAQKEIRLNKNIFDTLILKIRSFINDTNNYKYKDTDHYTYRQRSNLNYPIFSRNDFTESKYHDRNSLHYNTLSIWFEFQYKNIDYSITLTISEKYICFTTFICESSNNWTFYDTYFYRDLIEEDVYKFLYDFLNSKMQTQELFDSEKKQQLDSINFENYIPPEYLEKFKK